MSIESQIETQENIIKLQENIIKNANNDITNADKETDDGMAIIENAKKLIENANKLIEKAKKLIEELNDKKKNNDAQQITKEENIYVKVDGITYTILTEKEGKPQMEKEENEPVKTVFQMTRPDAKSCFTLKVDDNQPTERSLLNIVTMGKYGKGGNLKTKKRRITKKRVQKLRPFKSRSKK